jgi:hypothetical protein
MAAAWRPDFRWNAYAAWLIFGVGIAAAVIGLIDHALSWVVVGVVAAAIGLLLPRLHGQSRIGSPHIAMLEGDITAVGEPPEGREERVILLERFARRPPGEPPAPRG